MKKVVNDFLPHNLLKALGKEWSSQAPHSEDDNAWIKRPLPTKSIEYAAKDVHAIIHLHSRMVHKNIPDDWVKTVKKYSERRLNEFRELKKPMTFNSKTMVKFITARKMKFPPLPESYKNSMYEPWMLPKSETQPHSKSKQNNKDKKKKKKQ